MRQAVVRGCMSRALTLVEVVMALGIVSAVIIVVVGLFGALMTQRGDTSDRREATAAAEALPLFLNGETPFATVYGWLGAGPKALVFAHFRANDSGEPDPSGNLVISRWMDADALPASLEAAREGRPIRAEFEIDRVLNPSGATLDPLNDSRHSYIAAQAKIYPVPTVDSTRSGAVPVTVPVVILR